MATWAIQVDMPPKGKLEEGGGGVELSDEDMKEESAYRQEFLDYVSPKLAALLERESRRSANVTRIELQGADTWSNLNHYLLLVTVDIGGPGFDLEDLLPPEAEAKIIGDYDPLERWPKEKEEPTD
jgi:hypothetical protein